MCSCQTIMLGKAPALPTNTSNKLRRPLPHPMHQATLTQSIVDKHSIDWSPGWITTRLTRPLARKVIELLAARQCPPLLPALGARHCRSRLRKELQTQSRHQFLIGCWCSICGGRQPLWVCHLSSSNAEGKKCAIHGCMARLHTLHPRQAQDRCTWGTCSPLDLHHHTCLALSSRM